jgi:hypothetical protein
MTASDFDVGSLRSLLAGAFSNQREQARCQLCSAWFKRMTRERSDELVAQGRTTLIPGRPGC